jgi:hypothetical protein
MIETDKPGQGFGTFEESLMEAGVVLASQVVMLPEDVLSVIGDMGKARARIIRNYAKRIILPLLGLQGNYDEPEISASPNRAREGRTNPRESSGRDQLGGTELDGSDEGEDEFEEDDYEDELEGNLGA